MGSEEIDGYCLACGAVQIEGMCSDPDCPAKLNRRIADLEAEVLTWMRRAREAEAEVERLQKSIGDWYIAGYCRRGGNCSEEHDLAELGRDFAGEKRTRLAHAEQDVRWAKAALEDKQDD
jgi:hypothetical protein